MRRVTAVTHEADAQRRIGAMAMNGLLLLPLLSIGQAATYEIGPGRQFTSIGAAPWATLKPGDTVSIYWRADPYREKWVLCLRGTAEAPITVRGISGPNGELPVIEGSGATTAPGVNFWSEVRGVIKIGGASIPADTMPQYIVIDGLEVRGARRENSFRDKSGATQNYARNASGVYVEKGEHITIRNCIFRDNGNGFFVASSDDETSRDILVEGNYIYDNGNPGSNTEHNSYTAASGITFQFNRYGPLKAGATGNNLKDRSSALVIRYNWIEGGNRELDLVDAEDSIVIRNDPRYHETFVYGNVLIEPAGAGNRQIVHYGGDSDDEPTYRKGTLYFFHNTVISTRTDRTTLVRLSTPDERCDARNNIAWVSGPGSFLALLDEAGTIELSGNWMKPGWTGNFDPDFVPNVIDNGTFGSISPGFLDETAQDFRIRPDGETAGMSIPLAAAALPDHDVRFQYLKHQKSAQRSTAADVGAFESVR